jgi:hypothetical protein
MTPQKEKANELVEKYQSLVPSEFGGMDKNLAIDCALIAVDEILQAIDWHKFETPNVEIDFWQEVQNELLKMKQNE